MTSANKIARFSGLLLVALSTGVLFGTKAALGPSGKDLTARTYVEVQQATVRNLRPAMGTLMSGAVAANLAVLGLAARERRLPALALTLAGFLSNLAALVLTGIFELPINARVLTWLPENPPEGWESSMNRWQAVHTARTVISVIGLASLLAAALTSATGSDSDNATG